MKRARFSEEQIVRILREADKDTVVEVVKRPHSIVLVEHHQRLLWPCDDTFLGSPQHVQFHLTVNPMAALVISPISIHAKLVETIPETPAGMPLYDLVQGFNQSGIPLNSPKFILAVIRRPRKPKEFTGFAHLQAKLCN